MGIDLRDEFANETWYPSCLYDDHRAGILTEDNVIVLGIGAGLNYEQAKQMADEHNAKLGRREDGREQRNGFKKLYR